MDTWTVSSLYLSSVNCFHNLLSVKRVPWSEQQTHTHTLTWPTLHSPYSWCYLLASYIHSIIHSPFNYYYIIKFNSSLLSKYWLNLCVLRSQLSHNITLISLPNCQDSPQGWGFLSCWMSLRTQPSHLWRTDPPCGKRTRSPCRPTPWSWTSHPGRCWRRTRHSGDSHCIGTLASYQIDIRCLERR